MKETRRPKVRVWWCKPMDFIEYGEVTMGTHTPRGHSLEDPRRQVDMAFVGDVERVTG